MLYDVLNGIQIAGQTYEIIKFHCNSCHAGNFEKIWKDFCCNI